MANHWYVLNSKPGKEEALFRHVGNSGYEVFYPWMQVRPTNPHARKRRPYFPGYMFINIDLAQSGLSSFQWMPFSIGLVSFGGEPATVPDPLIYAIRQKVEDFARLKQNPVASLKKGEMVTILDGPLAGYQAVFDIRMDGKERVRVLLNLLSGQTVPVELRAGNIERTKRPGMA